MAKLYGSLEAGGTKFVCAVGDEKFQVIEKTQFPTTTPYETIDRTVEFFKRYEAMNLTERVHSTADVWKVWLLVHRLKPVQVFVVN